MATNAYDVLDAYRGSRADVATDSTALLGVDGYADSGTVPSFTNNTETSMEITLNTAEDVEFDVNDDNAWSAPPVTFTVSSGATTSVDIQWGEACQSEGAAVVDVISQFTDGTRGSSGSISLSRSFEIPCPEVTVDNVSSLDGGQDGSFTLTHDVGTGNNRAVYAFVQLMDTSSDKDVGTAAFNGNPMTEVTNVERDVKMQIFRLTNPASGSGTVSLDIDGTEENKAGIGVISFENVDQENPEDAVVSATGQGTSSTLSGISTTQEDLVVDGIATDKVIIGAGSNQVDQWRAEAESDKQGGGSTEEGSGSVDMSWSFNSGKYSHAAFNINNG